MNLSFFLFITGKNCHNFIDGSGGHVQLNFIYIETLLNYQIISDTETEHFKR